MGRWIVSRPARFALLGAATLLLLVAGGALGLRWFIGAAHPDYEGRFILPGLDAPVEILWDERGVPHLLAASSGDLYRAQGYLHARDRLWQLDFHRRVAEGRLSEVFGSDQIESDRFLRTLRLRDVATRLLDATSDEGRDALRAYADGVNAYLATVRRRPLEFRILGFEPERWEPRHSAAILALVAYNLGTNWSEQAARAALREAVDEARFRELLPPFDPEGTAAWTREKAAPAPVEAYLRVLDRNHLGGLAASLPALGSNGWVVAPERSATGHALLANDPHLPVGLPPLWYENRLQVEEGHHVYGWSFPGGPGVHLGHNDHIAWGMTNTGNTQDLFVEEVDPGDSLRVRGPGGWYTARAVPETIRVAGRDAPVIHTVRITRHGPILDTGTGVELSLRWTGYEVERSSLDAFLRLNRADSWEAFNRALEAFSVPAQAVVYADTAGHIGLRVAGDLPLRRSGAGAVPKPAWDADHDWIGRVPSRDLPRLLDPPRGFIATANHGPVDGMDPHPPEVDHAPPFRIERIVEVLGRSGAHGFPEAEALQTDWYNGHAARRLPGFLDALSRRSEALTDLERNALDVLRGWAEDPVNRGSEAGPALFESWYLELMEAVFRPAMGPEVYRAFLDGRGYLPTNALEGLLDRDASAWMPAGPEPLLLQSFRSAVQALAAAQGGTPGDWRWDALQSITFDHVLGGSPWLSPLVNRGPYPLGGGRSTVGRASYPLTAPFDVRRIAGVRFVISLESPVRARAVLAGGQSGHPGHPHSADQIPAWLGGSYHPLHRTREEVEADGPRRMLLVPATP